MQYMGGKSRIAGAIANIINEIPRRKIQNSGPDCLRHIRDGGGTTCKLKALDRYAENIGARVYVGIAADEPARLQKERKPYKAFPLADWGMTEASCLGVCYKAGYFWGEDGGAGTVRLYDILDHVSCWCCCNKNLKELRNIRKYLPFYWDKLKKLQSRLERPMKGFYKGQPRGVFELEKRFTDEEITT